MTEGLYVIAILLVVALPIARVVWVTRQRRYFVFFQVVDGRTGAPHAGAEVLGIRGRNHWSATGVGFGDAMVIEKRSAPKLVPLGRLDGQGRFRRELGFRSYGGFEVRLPGVVAGSVGVESVAEYTRFPSEPYTCAVETGRLVPPKRVSPLTQGLAPGEALRVRDGYTNRYEAPEKEDVVQCYATLDEVKQRAHGGGLDRYWKVSGRHVLDYDGGYQLTVERCERVR